MKNVQNGRADAWGRNLKKYRYRITQRHRSALKGHRACVLWLTGLSGSGKSTIAGELEIRLHRRRIHTQVLDGDHLRFGLNSDLGFSRTGRKENIRRAGEVAKLSVEAGLVVIAAFISPYRADREFVRSLFASGEFVEVFVDCPLAVCRKRDPKGFYKKAMQKKITGFTGIQAPFEAPLAPDIVLPTNALNVKQSAERIIAHLEKTKVIPRLCGLSLRSPDKRKANSTAVKERTCS